MFAALSWTTFAGQGLAADFDPFDDIDRVGAYEVWGGADAAARTWFAYSGVTVAPWGDIHAEGFRFRAVQGVGGYEYRYDAATRVKVAKSVSDIMIGYQFGVDDFTIKAFAGWSVLARRFEVPSLGATEARIEHGPKIGAEIWLDWSETMWAALDVSLAAPRETFEFRARAGTRLDNEISAGPEFVIYSSDLSGEVIARGSSYGTARMGAFVRYDWFGGEASLGGGLAADIEDPGSGVEAQRLSPYATLTVLMQF